MKKLLILLSAVILLTACDNTKRSNGEAHAAMMEAFGNKTPQPKAINVLWQDKSGYDSITAKKVAAINPDKFVINVDGPFSLDTKTTGPHPGELVSFVKYLTTYGYTGELVMHLDFNKAEFVHDWVGPTAKDTLWTSTSYKLYADYFVLLNCTLRDHHQRTFYELLIETEGSGFKGPGKVANQNKIFDNFKSHIKNDSIKLSATSDWTKTEFPTSADYYYAQMYDMCYIDTKSTILCGPNYPSPLRAKELAQEMKRVITLPRLDKVSFIFTYAEEPQPTKKKPNPKPHADAPMFGERIFDNDSVYWKKSDFVNFANEFKNVMPGASVGIWHCESPIKNWK